MPSLTPNAKQQFFTNAGLPAAGYQLYTYISGTGHGTPQATYTDAAGANPNTNPITLDARGEAVVYLTDGLTYDYVLKDSIGTIIWTRDGITSLIGFVQSGSGAVARPVQDKLREIVSVKDFGAKGDGTTDDTPAFAAAIVASTDIYVPVGTYKLTSPLVKTGDLRLHGVGRTATILLWGAATPSGAINVTNGALTIEGLAIRTSVAAGGVAVAIQMGSSSPGITMRDVTIEPSTGAAYWTTGIKTTDMRESRFDNVRIIGDPSNSAHMAYGINIGATSGATDTTFDGLLIHYAGTAVNVLSNTSPGTEGLRFSSCAFVGVGYGLVFDASAAGYTPPAFQMVNCHCSSTAGAIRALNVAQSVVMDCLFYKSGATTESVIQWDSGTANVTTDNVVVILGGTNAAVSAIAFTGTEDRAVAKNNTLNVQPTQYAISVGASVTNATVRFNQTNGGGTSLVVGGYPVGASGCILTDNYPQPTLATQVFAANSATPNVGSSLINFFKTNNTATTSITSFANAIAGQRFLVQVPDTKTTFVHSASLLMSGAINYSPTLGQMMEFVALTSSVCAEVSRSG